MQVEIPDPPVLLSLATAFVLGVLALVIYNKVGSRVDGGGGKRSSHLDEYERQLVEMKIRLDAMEVGAPQADVMPTSQLSDVEVTGTPNEAEMAQKEAKITPKPPESAAPAPSDANHAVYHNATERVLRMVTNEAKTSRAIQASLGKSREHTARLLKKLYDAGLVQRSAGSRPYAYKITEAGRKRLEAAGKGG